VCDKGEDGEGEDADESVEDVNCYDGTGRHSDIRIRRRTVCWVCISIFIDGPE
jgi:hypothetical protein